MVAVVREFINDIADKRQVSQRIGWVCRRFQINNFYRPQCRSFRQGRLDGLPACSIRKRNGFNTPPGQHFPDQCFRAAIKWRVVYDCVAWAQIGERHGADCCHTRGCNQCTFGMVIER